MVTRLCRVGLPGLTLLMLSACGGGSSGGQTGSSPTYITCANFTAPAAATLPYAGATTAASVDTSSLPTYSQDALTTMTVLENLEALVPVPLETAPGRESCSSSGALNGSGSAAFVIDERPDGTGYGYAQYIAYPATSPAGGNYILDGVAYATFAPISTSSPQTETVSFINYHVTSAAGINVTLNGTMTIQAPANVVLALRDINNETVNVDMVIDDTRHGRTVWVHNFGFSDTTDTTLGSNYVDRSVSGTLYDATYGFTTISSVNPLILALRFGNQGISLQSPGGGPLKLAGGTASIGYFLPLSLTLDAIALDDAGNGTLDKSARIDARTFQLDTTSYPSLSGPVPMAAVGNAATVTESSVPPSVDGLRSYSPAGKFLTYNWSVLSKPGASSASLSNATSAVPTFVPDKPGTYLLRLTVSDGQTSNSQDVALKAQADFSGAALQPSHAIAGPDLQAHVGQTVTVDGSASIGIDTNVWAFQWTLVRPPGSNASLSYTKPFAISGDQTQTSFVPDVPGFYMLVLEESGINGYLQFAPGTTQIIAVDTGFDLDRPATVVDSSVHTFGFKYAVGDFNGDGIMDVATAALVGSHAQVDVFYGSKQGGFSAPTSIVVTNGSPNALYAADVNNDGRTDLVVDATGVFTILQQSNGTLGTPVQIGASSSCVTAGSALQLLGVGPWKSAITNSIYTYGSGCVDIYNNTSATTFASAGTIANPFVIYPYSVRIADLTGDGIADVLGSNCSTLSPALDLFPGQASGSFGSAVAYGLPNLGTVAYPCQSPVVGDFNHDGLLDAAAMDGDAIDLFLQDSSHAFMPATHPSILTQPTSYLGFATADLAGGDLNSDGRADLLMHHFDYLYTDPSNSSILVNLTYLGVLFQNSTGSFGSEWLYPLGLYWGYGIINTNPIAVGDFNGDGLPDVITMDGSGSLMVVYQKPFN